MDRGVTGPTTRTPFRPTTHADALAGGSGVDGGRRPLPSLALRAQRRTGGSRPREPGRCSGARLPRRSSFARHRRCSGTWRHSPCGSASRRPGSRGRADSHANRRLTSSAQQNPARQPAQSRQPATWKPRASKPTHPNHRPASAVQQPPAATNAVPPARDHEAATEQTRAPRPPASNGKRSRTRPGSPRSPGPATTKPRASKPTRPGHRPASLVQPVRRCRVGRLGSGMLRLPRCSGCRTPCPGPHRSVGRRRRSGRAAVSAGSSGSGSHGTCSTSGPGSR